MMPARKNNSGFVLPMVLGIILLAGLFAVAAFLESGSAALLSTRRQLHQSAFEAAETGIAILMDQLNAGVEPARMQTLDPAALASGSSTVQTTITTRTELAEGFSAGRIIETDYEISSAGHSARSGDVRVVQGVSQRRSAGAP
jgi:Tfp pilus assembly protein PilX